MKSCPERLRSGPIPISLYILHFFLLSLLLFQLKCHHQPISLKNARLCTRPSTIWVEAAGDVAKPGRYLVGNKAKRKDVALLCGYQGTCKTPGRRVCNNEDVHFPASKNDEKRAATKKRDWAKSASLQKEDRLPIPSASIKHQERRKSI